METEAYGRRALGHALRAERHVASGTVHAARLHYGRVVHYAKRARESQGSGVLSVVQRAETAARNVARAIKGAVEREVTAERLGTIAGLAAVGVTGALIVSSMREPGAASSYEELLELGHTKRSIKLACDEWHDEPDAPNEPKGTSAKAPFPGLENLGNTCFMNAAIQCLVSVPSLKSLFLSATTYEGCTSEGTSKVALAFVSLVREMASGALYVVPRDLVAQTQTRAWARWNDEKSRLRSAMEANGVLRGAELDAAVENRRPDLTKGGQQSDPHEFLTFLLEELECVPSVTTLLTSKKEITSVCPQCNGRGDPIVDLSLFLQLNIPSAQTTLAQCLAAYNQTEEVDYTCEHCRRTVTAQREHVFVTLPDVLAIHLKRFSNDAEAKTARKTCTIVTFEEGLDVGGVQYALTGFVSHEGNSANSGHYTAVCKAGGRWYTFNDETVTLYTASFEDHYKGAYLLVYEKRT